jgi:capsid protein
MNDGSDSDFHEEIRCHKSAEWIRAGLASRMVALRAEKPRELSEEIRREAKEASAARRSRPEWHKHGKRADRHKKRAARTDPRTTATSANHVELSVN